MINLINIVDPINNVINIGLDLGPGYLLPRDIALVIFQNSKKNLANLSLVSKNWKAHADDKYFLQMIRPLQTFGTKEWKQYIGVDAGDEAPLPRWAYGFIEEGNYMVTFIPKNVKVTNEDGTTKDVALDHLKVIEELISKQSKGTPIVYAIGYWFTSIEKRREPCDSHWVFISREGIGLSKDLKEQQALAKQNGTRISGLIDTVISVYMEYFKSGQRHFVFEPSGNAQGTVIRLDDDIDGWRVGLSFMPSGLRVECSGEVAANDVFFLPSRMSIPKKKPGLWKFVEKCFIFFLSG